MCLTYGENAYLAGWKYFAIRSSIKPSAIPAVGDGCAWLPLSFSGVLHSCLGGVLLSLDVDAPPPFPVPKSENIFENCDNSSKKLSACWEFFNSPSRGLTERSKSGFCER